MTKKELIAKLDELGGRIEEVRNVLKKMETQFQDVLDEMDALNNFVNDELPQEIDEITDDVIVTEN